VQTDTPERANTSAIIWTSARTFVSLGKIFESPYRKKGNSCLHNIRRCNPTYAKKGKDASNFFAKFTRSSPGSNTLRRTAGDYTSGVNGPCSLKNKGAKKNYFNGDDPKRSSLEEFPMAFTVEGGITEIED
jgi:hypothetical protein